MRRSIGAVACAAVVVVAGGCKTGSDVDAGRPAYPTEIRQEVVLDVQVVRNDTEITMTNTTARSIGRSLLWVNGWYSREIEGFGVGQTLTLNLYEFKDQYGTPFRGGGFFATERPERVVLAQVEPLEGDSKELIGLVVVGRSED